MATAVGYRIFALGGCVVLLVGLFVLAGAGYPAPASANPDLANSDVDPRDLTGEHVQTGGIVTETEPVIIEIDDGTSTQQLPIENAPDAAVGQEVIVDGTLTADGTLRANRDRAVVREPWETTYMYAISILGALFVALRIADGWRFDLKTVSFSPRDTPLHRSLLEDTTDG
ncbi:hypothetical protein SAMN06266787_11216 [Halorubrum ezzemoulense]|uniref:Uncharacterized protein n=1 Tax=Halorubrum ezzemoulense TaxID=337243 RepID=A0A238YFK3_HALEZ|nr:hypothetical protein [Halorubrum ezzemoulense]SNR70046.1 hypothetical protein SAMN06266787_11216 [Halorubrum ezzemoulense]